MGELRQHLQVFRTSQALSEMDMEMTKQSSELNPTLLDNFTIADFSLETLLVHQLPEFQVTATTTTITTATTTTTTPTDEEHVSIETKKRKSMEQQPSDMSENTNTRKNKGSGKGKKPKCNEKVVHVRARRGQATDSHSLAERVRRENINEKMRCLRDLVPGCDKTMGMAVMLDEIINYVHSLQNQVEFLSTELAAASSSFDLNLETECIKKTQGTSSHVGQQMEKWAKDGYGEDNCFNLTWPL